LRQSGASVTPEIFSLAEKSWKVFSPFLCRYQWGKDAPSHSPRKREIASAILNRGKAGSCTFDRDGEEYILRPLHLRHFERAIGQRHKIFYVSYGKQALLYFDIDLHYNWQTLADGQEAKEKLDGLLTKFFKKSSLFWSPSSRGFNGYVKVDLKNMGFEAANQVFDRFEADLRHFLASCGNMADFEIKGKIGHMQDDGHYHWASYGKLPIHHPEWTFAKLEEFSSTPAVSIHGLSGLCDMLEARVPVDVLVRHKEMKRNKGDEPIRKGNRFLVTPAIEKMLLDKHGECWPCMFSLLWGGGDETWLDERYYRPGKVPLTESELRKEQDERRHFDQIACNTNLVQGHRQPGSNQQGESSPGIAEIAKKPRRDDQRDSHAAQRVARKRGPVNLDFSDLMGEPDSLKRQRKALLRYARYLKRVPSLDEGMQLLHDHDLYTGSWEDNLARRRDRVRDILKFIAGSFDASKCANGTVNVGKYDAWAESRFPNGLIGGKRRYMSEDGDIMEACQGIHVSTQFIAVFMAVAEFALFIDKNQDDSLPHDRAQLLWNSLYAKGLISVKFNARKWAVCREELDKHGIIAIIDRNYGPDKAMKWAPGRYFPFVGLWKGTKAASRLGPVILQRKRRKRREIHNTLLHSQSVATPVFERWRLSRPPPSPVCVS
jgi:hypothetical protein